MGIAYSLQLEKTLVVMWTVINDNAHHITYSLPYLTDLVDISF